MSLGFRLALPPRGFDVTQTSFSATDFSLKDMNLCGAAIRGMSVGARSNEEVLRIGRRILVEFRGAGPDIIDVDYLPGNGAGFRHESQNPDG